MSRRIDPLTEAWYAGKQSDDPPPGEPLRPEVHPWSVLQQLRPHYSLWEAVPREQLGTDYRPREGERVFVRERKGWQEVDNLYFVEIGQPLFVVRRKAPRQTDASAAWYQPRRLVGDDPVPQPPPERWPPQVSISDPLPTCCDHTARCLCLYGTVPLDQNRRVEWKGGRPWLAVSGSFARADELLLEWTGPGQGSVRVPLDPRHCVWSTRIPVEPGEYRLQAIATGPAGQSRSRPVSIRVVDGLEVEELLYDTAANRFIAIGEDQRARLMAAAEPLDQALRRYQRLLGEADADPAALGQAEEAVHQALLETNRGRPVGDGHAAGAMRELVALRARRWIYVSDEKLARALGEHPLQADLDDPATRRLTQTPEGRFSGEGLKRALRRQGRRAAQNLGEHTGIQFRYQPEPYKKDFTEFARAFNEQPETLLYRRRDARGNATLRVTDEARVLRATAGFSLLGRYAPAKGQIQFQGEGNAQFALLEDAIKAQRWYPHENGHPIKVLLPQRGGESRELTLCRMRARLALELTGFAGASACVAADLSFGTAPGRLLVQGVEDPERLRKEQDRRFRTRVRRGFSFFAGARDGASATGYLEWDNPDARRAGKPGWRPLASLGAHGHLATGLGLGREYLIVFENGRFHTLFKASAVFGVGCGGEIACTVEAGHIVELVTHVYQELRRADFDRVEFIKVGAFRLLWRMQLRAIWEAGQTLERVYEEGEMPTTHWWETIQNELDESGPLVQSVYQLIRRILREEWLLKTLIPESRGHLLWVLVHADTGPRGVDEKTRDQALDKLFDSLQSQRDRQETLEHLSRDATRLPSAEEGLRLLASRLTGPRWAARLARLDALPERAPYDTPLLAQSNPQEPTA